MLTKNIYIIYINPLTVSEEAPLTFNEGTTDATDGSTDNRAVTVALLCSKLAQTGLKSRRTMLQQDSPRRFCHTQAIHLVAVLNMLDDLTSFIQCMRMNVIVLIYFIHLKMVQMALA